MLASCINNSTYNYMCVVCIIILNDTLGLMMIYFATTLDPKGLS